MSWSKILVSLMFSFLGVVLYTSPCLNENLDAVLAVRDGWIRDFKRYFRMKSLSKSQTSLVSMYRLSILCVVLIHLFLHDYLNM